MRSIRVTAAESAPESGTRIKSPASVDAFRESYQALRAAEAEVSLCSQALNHARIHGTTLGKAIAAYDLSHAEYVRSCAQADWEMVRAARRAA